MSNIAFYRDNKEFIFTRFLSYILLCIRHHQENEKKNLNTVFKFLRQLYITEYGLHNFRDEWKSIVSHKHKSETGKTYLVSCDVKDAFGSIKQGMVHATSIILYVCKCTPKFYFLSRSVI